MKNIEKDINKALQELQEEIDEKQNQMSLIKNIDWSKPVDEETWHEICETPLRSSDLLSIIVKNIFTEAEKIKIGCNYVYFNLYGFDCGLPTSRCNGIYIKTDWYEKDNGEPCNPYFGNHANIKKYFCAKDSGENWEILFKYRLPHMNSYKKWLRFFLWFGYYKWKNDHKKEWEEILKNDENSFKERVEKYREKRNMIHQNSMKMIDVLIPELKKFSDKIHTLDGNWYKVEDIIKWENL